MTAGDEAREQGPPPADLLAGASLFLDFDGTLVEIAERPDAVAVSERLNRLMDRLHHALGGRLALISGRPGEQLCALLGAPRFTVAGSHGMDFFHPDGRTEVSERPAALADVRKALAELAREWPGVLLEDKPLGAALHYRQCPEAGERCIEAATALAREHGLHLQSGKMMVEVRAAGGDKGTAIERLMELEPFRGARPVFVGDDDTDEPGFVAAQAFGGAGVLVGLERPSAARYRLADTEAVLAWLEASVSAA